MHISNHSQCIYLSHALTIINIHLKFSAIKANVEKSFDSQKYKIGSTTWNGSVRIDYFNFLIFMQWKMMQNLLAANTFVIGCVEVGRRIKKVGNKNTRKSSFNSTLVQTKWVNLNNSIQNACICPWCIPPDRRRGKSSKSHSNSLCC